MSNSSYSYLLLLSPYVAWQDASQAWEMGFQEPDTSVIAVDLEQAICLFLLFFLLLSLFVLVWQLIPCYVYCMDEAKKDGLTVILDGTAHGCFWEFKYSIEDGRDFKLRDCLSFGTKDLPVITESSSEIDVARQVLVVPANYRIKFRLKSADSFHTLTVPSNGFSCDAVPNRLNQQTTIFTRKGFYHGGCRRCSRDPILARFLTTECNPETRLRFGAHLIIIKAVSVEEFLDWASWKNQKQKPSHPDSKPTPRKATASLNAATKNCIEALTILADYLRR